MKNVLLLAPPWDTLWVSFFHSSNNYMPKEAPKITLLKAPLLFPRPLHIPLLFPYNNPRPLPVPFSLAPSRMPQSASTEAIPIFRATMRMLKTSTFHHQYLQLQTNHLCPRPSTNSSPSFKVIHKTHQHRCPRRQLKTSLVPQHQLH